MQKILSTREKRIFYLTLGVAAFALCYNFFLSPVAAKFDQLNRQIELTGAKLNKYTRLLEQKEAIRASYEKYASGLPIAEGQEKASPLADLENLCRNSGIRILDLRPQGANRSSLGYSEALIDLRAEGSIEGYMNFMYNLENSLALLRVKSFQLSVRPNTTDLEGNFSISQFSPAEK